MTRIGSIREAKEYLAGRVVAEAEREGVSLSEVERNMLYFSEAGWTLPDMMRISQEFDRDYDQDEYEKKIGGLVRAIVARDAQNEQETEAWDEAVLKLCDEDHYLLVLIDAAAQPAHVPSSFLGKLEPWLPTLDGRAKREPGDVLRLLVSAVTILVLIFMSMLLATWFRR